MKLYYIIWKFKIPEQMHTQQYKFKQHKNGYIKNKKETFESS